MLETQLIDTEGNNGNFLLGCPENMVPKKSQNSTSMIDPFDYINSDKYNLRLEIITDTASGLIELNRDKEQEQRERESEIVRLQDVRKKRMRQLEIDHAHRVAKAKAE